MDLFRRLHKIHITCFKAMCHVKSVSYDNKSIHSVVMMMLVLLT